MDSLRILHIEDNPGDVRLIREALSDRAPSPITLDSAPSLRVGLARLASAGADLVLLDLGLPDGAGLETLSRVRAAHPDTLVIVLTGLEDEALGAEAIEKGAQDYLSKAQVSGPVLHRSIRYARHRHRDRMQLVALHQELQLYQKVCHFSAEGIVATDRDGTLVTVNPAFCRITGYAEHELLGRNLRMLASGEHNTAFVTAALATMDREGFWQGEMWYRRASGDLYPALMTVAEIQDAADRVTHYVGTLVDITERKKAEEKIHDLAFFDSLTRLPNRRMLLDRLRQAFAGSARRNTYGAVFFIDLDHFKTLNDTKGHDFGDLLLVEVAQRVLGCVRGEDTVARIGGDEFVVALINLGEKVEEAATQARAVGEKILAAISRPYMLKGHRHDTTPSIGVSLFHGHDQTVDDLLKRADVAMYQAKTAGRCTIRFFDPAMQAALNTRTVLESELRRAIDRGQLRLYYQVQIDSTRGVVGAEALLRWEHPDGAMVLPAQFIPMAEDTGLIVPIGQWVMEAACAQLKRWGDDDRTRHLQLAVNVCPRQFRQEDFVCRIQEALQASGADPSHLKLELTERLMHENVADTIAKMNALKGLGIGFSMDDFGTGYSSLSNLKRLPLYQLKIDQSFVRDLVSDPNDVVIVKTIISMANSLGLAVIAEGVETEAQRELLLQLGCVVCQGYLCGRPVQLAEFERQLDVLATSAPSREWLVQ